MYHQMHMQRTLVYCLVIGSKTKYSNNWKEPRHCYKKLTDIKWPQPCDYSFIICYNTCAKYSIWNVLDHCSKRLTGMLYFFIKPFGLALFIISLFSRQVSIQKLILTLALHNNKRKNEEAISQKHKGHYRKLKNLFHIFYF